MTPQPLISDVINTLEESFPPRYQESFDNTGLQLGDTSRPCTGVLLCVDVTPDIIAEAIACGCNLIISHHPLIFNALKRIAGEGRVEKSVIAAIRNDIAIYSCHTAVDNTPSLGVSWRMAQMLGLTDIRPLEVKGPEGIGCGVVGNLPNPLSPTLLVDLIKTTFKSPIARCSNPEAVGAISRLALCGGAGGFLIPDAIKHGAQAFLTSDCRLNLFLDFVGQIFLVDIGHYESEACTRDIFRNTLAAHFPTLNFISASADINPINYI